MPIAVAYLSLDLTGTPADDAADGRPRGQTSYELRYPTAAGCVLEEILYVHVVLERNITQPAVVHLREEQET